ncbi:50S ribosomal protein L14 [Penicillium digitatum PHI26]|uniref:Large ribosomal subunit protein uL14m n=2 Tax=Penicillium digitatum TaxID=36651 RepID=K9GFQ8_PEND2|nr:50S ribosomal protein L14 [Penicillium digitatum Pd1]EKV05108.1 50S ribosomal protein L14 [Penicillium digitatum Pd1]EKV13623.1 50S ribosomal protein L14 [Penicillium digitatum PHI26]
MLTLAPPDTIKLHRQLRRLDRRVRERPEEEAARDNRSVSTALEPSTQHSKKGDRIVVVVQKQRSAGSEATTAAALASKVRRGDIRHAVVVRVKKELQRPDGSLVRFGDNACVLVNKSGDPIGTRMNGVVGQELRNKKWSKILSLAPIHV